MILAIVMIIIFLFGKDILKFMFHVGQNIWYPLELYFRPVELFERCSISSNVFTLPILFKNWHFFTNDDIDGYFQLNKHEYCTAMEFRSKVPHLNFKDISPRNLVEKTSISKFAIMHKIRNTSIADLEMLVGKYGKIPEHIPDLQRFCFDITASAMLEFLFGSSTAELFNKSVIDSMYFYSDRFHPRTIWLGEYHPKLGKHQDVVKKFMWKLYDIYSEKHRNNIIELKKILLQNEEIPKSANLIDFYMAGVLNKREYFITRDDFVWLMNATIWAAIHYPALILTASILRLRQNFEGNNSGIVKEMMRLYSPMMIPKTLVKNVKYKGIQMQKGDVICMSPFAHHLDEKYYSSAEEMNPERWQQPLTSRSGLYTGTKGEWACPAILFSVKWISAFLDEFMKYDISAIDELPKERYSLALLHYGRKISVCAFKKE